ncbi:MAG: hypothetical protein CMO34_06100 [Verrucomicrobia bacterium]|nr:hypothetical protein [Verrucomicrobiota bacterium]
MRIRLDQKSLVLLAHILMLLLYRFWGYSGHFGYDDIEYARLSTELTNGVIEANNHFFYRWAIILPTTLMYSLFGINDVSSSIPPIIAASLTLYFVYKTLKNKHLSTVWVALTMTTTAQWFLFYSNKLMSDIYIGLSFTMCIYFVHQLWYNSRHSEWRYALLFVASLFVGIMAKGTIVFMLPLIVFFIAIDVYKKRHLKFWLSTSLFGFTFLLLYFAIIYGLTNNPFSRIDAIASNGYLNKCSYGAQSLAILLKRIGQDFFGMVRNEGFAGIVIIAFSPLLFRPKDVFSSKSDIGFFISSAFILFFAANFMSISITSYNPMCIDFRHYLFLVPIMAIAASMVLHDKDFLKQYSFTILVFFGLLLYSTWHSKGVQFEYTYLPLWILLLANHLLKNGILNAKIPLFALALTFTLLIYPIKISLNARKYNYPKQQELIKEKIQQQEQSLYVFTDAIQARIGNYQFGFDSSIVKFIDYDAIEKHHINSARGHALLINPKSQNLMYTGRKQRPFYLSYAFNHYSPDTLDTQLNMYYYSLDSIVEPRLTGRFIQHSLNRFDSISSKHWVGKVNELDKTQFNSKPTSNRVENYSHTFLLQLDSIGRKPNESIYVHTSLKTRLNRQQHAQLIFSVEKAEGSYIYQATDLNPFQNVYEYWWGVAAYISIPANQLQENSTLKVYIWNQYSEALHIDDFDINIFGYYE